jgi:LysM repeat protein
MATLVAGGLCVAGATAAQATSGATSARGSAGAGQVVVQPGETLWSIAKHADPGADTQTIVQEMVQVNRLAGPDIAPGQHLWVPRG